MYLQEEEDLEELENLDDRSDHAKLWKMTQTWWTEGKKSWYDDLMEIVEVDDSSERIQTILTGASVEEFPRWYVLDFELIASN
jgi:hypothetical protein